MRGLLAGMLLGAAAGAAGTTMLNTVTYLDMVARARPASTTPEDTVEALSKKTHISVPGQGEDRTNRVAGLGSLTGIAAGVGTGALLGLARAAGYRPGTVVTGLSHWSRRDSRGAARHQRADDGARCYRPPHLGGHRLGGRCHSTPGLRCPHRSGAQRSRPRLMSQGLAFSHVGPNNAAWRSYRDHDGGCARC